MNSDRAAKRVHLQAWRAKHKASGLCLECNRPVVASLRGTLGVMCQYHRELHSKSWKRRCDARRGGPPKLFPLDSYLNLSPVDLAYVGALIDGEGHVSLRAKHIKKAHLYSPVIAVGMTDREPLEYLISLFGGTLRSYQAKRGNRKLAWHWVKHGRQAGAIAKAIQPYLKITRKIETARLMALYAETMGKVNHWRVDMAVDVWRERMSIIPEVAA